MQSPAAAIAWEFRYRHRWALLGLAGYLFVLVAVKVLMLGPEIPVRMDPPNGVAATAIVPFSAAFFYLLGVFTFGLAGDLAARQSIYPTRLFTLPVTSAALASWPMLYGAVAMTSLWLVTALLAKWPWGIDVPFIWPALLAAAFLAWTQVLTWMSYGLPGLRVIATVLALITLDAVVVLAIHFEASELQMVAFLAPQLPLAYGAGCLVVARARRGDVPDWRGAFAWLGRGLPARRDHAPSPSRAQRWFEWQRHGRSLPVWVGMVLPFLLALLFLAGSESTDNVFYTLTAALLTPPFVAAFTAAAVGKSSDSYGVTPFVATRPMTSAALVAAKLSMSIWSTLAAWVLVVVFIPIALTLSGTWPVVITWAYRSFEWLGAPRALAVIILVAGGLLASTWKQLVQGLCIGLTGREWLVKSSVLLRLSLLIAILPAAEWIHDSGNAQVALWNAFPWILWGLVCLKMSAAAWIAVRLYDGRVLSDRTLVAGAACWLVVVLALYGVFVWFFATPLIPRYVLLLIAILAVPLARPSAAPLALAWNRHR